MIQHYDNTTMLPLQLYLYGTACAPLFPCSGECRTSEDTRNLTAPGISWNDRPFRFVNTGKDRKTKMACGVRSIAPSVLAQSQLNYSIATDLSYT